MFNMWKYTELHFFACQVDSGPRCEAEHIDIADATSDSIWT